MFPVRCYTCNALLGHKHAAYAAQTRSGTAPRDALAHLEVDRMCCRRMFLGHIDLMEDRLRYPNTNTVLDDGGTVLQRHVPNTRVVSCD